MELNPREGAKEITMERAELENMVTELSRKLADEGLLIKAGLVGYKAAVYSEVTLPADQEKQVEMAFMGGALHLFSSIMNILDPGAEPTDSDLGKMDMISAELTKYGERFAAALPTKGNA